MNEVFRRYKKRSAGFIMRNILFKYKQEIVIFLISWCLLIILRGQPPDAANALMRVLGIALGRCFYILIKGEFL